MALLLTFSCTHKVFASTCRSRPSPCLLQIPMAALLSVQTLTDVDKPKSLNRAC